MKCTGLLGHYHYCIPIHGMHIGMLLQHNMHTCTYMLHACVCSQCRTHTHTHNRCLLTSWAPICCVSEHLARVARPVLQNTNRFGYGRRLVNTNMLQNAVDWTTSKHCHELLLFVATSPGGSRTGQVSSVAVGRAEWGGGGRTARSATALYVHTCYIESVHSH